MKLPGSLRIIVPTRIIVSQRDLVKKCHTFSITAGLPIFSKMVQKFEL